mgnify:CR=1 FL=1
MEKIKKEAKALLMIASAAWLLGFMGMMGASAAAKVVGVAVVIAVEAPAAEEASADE